MKSIVIHAAKDLRIEETAPEPLGAGQVEIRLTTGGSAVRIWITSTRAVSPSRPCHQFSYCQRAMVNRCLNMRFYGSAMPFPHIQGAFRQVLVADASQCMPADGLTAGEAAMAEPLAVCLYAARREGADFIAATDLSDFTLGVARQAGADVALNTAQVPKALAAFTQDKGRFDVLYECSGAASARIAAIPAMRPGGVIIQLGLGGDMTLPVQTMTAKELSLRGFFRFYEESATGVSLMQKGVIDVQPFITQTFPLSQALQAFQTAGDRSRAMKAQIVFD
ncbi:zinc-binding dehydrogenase [Cypionkella sp.]|uniref:zinc-binding dehydrogenase n=1 Tax=Cypionkella sp. TaxID=2811411 RepID=UPI00375131A6